jgi:phospholipid-binding lipoprotein MlaA
MESFNRTVFGFNDALDAAVVKPTATAYKALTPNWVRKGVSNFFNNLQDMWSVVNTAAQGRGQEFSDSVGRVMINTSLGMLGLIDIASDLNIDRHTADFGMTLGRWGVPAGPYVVLPVLGPYTLREVAALPVDFTGDPSYRLGGSTDAQNGATVMKFIDKRTNLLGASDVLEGAALDKYSFVRDSYFQRQRSKQYDGNPPDEEDVPQ